MSLRRAPEQPRRVIAVALSIAYLAHLPQDFSLEDGIGELGRGGRRMRQRMSRVELPGNFRLSFLVRIADFLFTGVVDTGCRTVHLTAREVQVLCLAAAGLADRDIAGELTISLRTAEFHLARMLARTGARNRTELVARSYAAGILVPGQWPPAWSGSRCADVTATCDAPEPVFSPVTSGYQQIAQ